MKDTKAITQLVISLTVLCFCLILFLSGGNEGRFASLPLIGLIIGYWFPSPSQQAVEVLVSEVVKGFNDKESDNEHNADPKQ